MTRSQGFLLAILSLALVSPAAGAQAVRRKATPARPVKIQNSTTSADNPFDDESPDATQKGAARAAPPRVAAPYNGPEPPPAPMADAQISGAMETMPAAGMEGSCDSQYCYDDECGNAWRRLCGSGPPRGFWGRVEWIDWFAEGNRLPPLVTFSPPGTLQANAGVLPAATTTFGGRGYDTNARNGARATLGYWLDECETRGIESITFGLNEGGTTFTDSGDGSANSRIIGRPFFNVQRGSEDAGLVAFPSLLGGSITAATTSQIFGTEVNLRKAIRMNCCTRWDMITGYRLFRVDEDLQIRERTTVTQVNGQVPLGTTQDIFDSFGTRNVFHGGNLGLAMQYRSCRWTLDSTVKVALGGMSQRVAIDGRTTTTVPNAGSATNSGGFLALDSNIGRHERTHFAAVPEVNFNLSYQLNCLWKFNVGYTLIYATNVLRTGDAIDRNIDPAGFPPVTNGTTFTRPAFAFNDSDMWLQGVNVGVEARF